MSAFVDLTSKVCGEITVLRKSHSVKGKGWYWICKCNCNPEKEITLLGTKLITQRFCSSQCPLMKKGNFTHGKSGTVTYSRWLGMKSRCSNPNNVEWGDYGGRGITICKSWQSDYEVFEKDMGVVPSPELEIDRIDNDKGYWCGKPTCSECSALGREPNCRWTTSTENQRNKRTSHYYTHDGQTKTIGEWAEMYNMSWGALAYRIIDKKMDFMEAVTTPVKDREYGHEYNGEWKQNEELSKVCGVPCKLIQERISSGWTVEQAVETPKCKNQGLKLEYEGKEYTLSSLARHLGISVNVFYSRYITHKWSIEEIINTPVNKYIKQQPQ